MQSTNRWMYNYLLNLNFKMAILTSGKLFGANEYVCKSKRMYTVRCKSSEGMVWFFKWSVSVLI